MGTQDPARAFLGGFAADRRHWLRFGVPNEDWAARRVLLDYCTGELLHCEPPPDRASASVSIGSASLPRVVEEQAPKAAPVVESTQAADDSDDFDDLDEFLGR